MKIKRLMALLISVVMVFAMMPAFVFAKEIDLEADEPATEESSDAEEEKEESEEKEEPSESDEDKDDDTEEEENIPVEEYVIVGKKAPESTSSAGKSVYKSGSCGSGVRYVLDGGYLKITGNGKMKNYSSAGAVPWYENRKDITSFYISSGVRSIGAYCFFECSNIRSGSIWSYSRGKKAMKSVGAYAFSGTNVGSISLPSTITSIGAHAFENSALTKFSPKSKVKSIGTACFKGCTNLTSFSFNKKITKIPNECFSGCTKLTSISVPNRIKSIGRNAFAASGLKSFTIPSKVKTIAAELFYNCRSLTSVKIHSKVKSIGASAFELCTNLTSISMPAKLKSFGSRAFAGSGLTTVKIPGKIKTISNGAFWSCKSLTSVTIPGSVKTIGEGAFAVSGLTSIVIPKNVTTIGRQAFVNCTALKSVTMNYGLKTVNDEAFSGCTSLPTISFPISVNSWGTNVLKGSKSGIKVYVANEYKGVSTIWGNSSISFQNYTANPITVTGKTATVKAKKVKKKAQKIAAAKLYKFDVPGTGAHVFGKVSGNKKITVASNGVITVKKGLKKGTYKITVKVRAVGDSLTIGGSDWTNVVVTVRVK